MTVKAPRGIAFFEESLREFSGTVAAAQKRTASFTGPKTDLTQDPALLREALEELRVHQEELSVANEELRAQLEELGSATARIHFERDRYRKLFDLTPDSYFVTDHHGTICDVNGAGSRMLEVDARFLVGKPLGVLVDAADSRMLREAVSALRSKPSIELELRFKRRNNEPQWHTLKAVTLEEEKAILWFARNVQAEHDARVANAVLGWTQLLRREILDVGARDRALATIERNAQTQLRLIVELLDISRIAGDRRRLGQVLSNLVSNALEFMAPGGGRVTLELQRDGRDARIVLTDTGRGIAQDRLAHLFEPFRQVNHAATHEAVGVGLYIVRQFVQLHGGRVFAESEGPERGARFTVVLPLADAYASAPKGREPASERLPSARAGADGNAPASRRAETGALEGIRVLVVDDEEDARELMATILRHHGAVVSVAADVPSALHAFEASPPDVVLSDIALPGRSGLDLARDLRGRAQLDATLVAVSGFAAPDQIDRALTAGFDIHMAKPVDPTELVEVVRDAARLRTS